MGSQCSMARVRGRSHPPRQWKPRGMAYDRIMAHAGRRWTRRGILATGLAAAGAAFEGRKVSALPTFPSDAKRYADPSTGLDVVRLTDPAYSSTLPAYYNRAIASNSGYLLIACDRTGSPQAFRLDLKTGETQQLTQAEGLDGATVTLTPDNRAFCYCAGRSLFLAGSNRRNGNCTACRRDGSWGAACRWGRMAPTPP